MEEQQFNDDLYWDLAELNPNAIVYTEYTPAYLGFALKNNNWVACYDMNVLEGLVAKEIFSDDEEWLKKTFKELDGKVKNTEVQEAVTRLAMIEAGKRASDLVEPWDTQEHAPICVHLPKLIQAMDEAQQQAMEEQAFKYNEE
tara:strand:- start:3253 stop:3681 length:429 start_codon:yes stop_codon:yes gene_type:complete